MATSAPVPGYGGIALSEEGIVMIAKELQTGKIPHSINHNAIQRLDTDIRLIELRRTDSGSLGVWVEMYVDENQWRSEGHLGGFSVTVVSDTLDPDTTSRKPVIELFADAGQFDDEAFQDTVEALRKDFAVGGGRLYQFSIEPPPNVIVEIAVSTIGGAASILLAGALSMIFAKLFKPKHAHESIFTIRVRDGNKVQNCRLTTSDPEIAKIAAETWKDAVLSQQKSELLQFDNHSLIWKQADRSNDAQSSPGRIPSPLNLSKNSVRHRTTSKSSAAHKGKKKRHHR